MTWDPDSPIAWRVADMINFAAHYWQHRLIDREARDFLDEGRVDVQLALMLITYAHRQGLSPNDLDTTNGPAALRALAEALAADRELRRVIKNDLFRAAYGGKSTLLTGEWKDVHEACEYLLEKQPRRYEVTRE